MKTLLVIDPSRTIRETLRIVLGPEHDVRVAPSCELADPAVAPALVILGLPPPPRDDRRTASALARIAPTTPLLLLHAPDEVDLHALVAPARRVDFLPKPFDAYTLRARVRAVLAERTPPRNAPEDRDDVRAFIEYPFVSHAAAALAQSALANDLPVLLSGERGTGAIEVGRALHVLGGRTGPFTVRTARGLAIDELAAQHRHPTPAERDGGTLLIDDVHGASAELQAELLVLVEASPVARGVPRILAATGADLDARVAAGAFLPELAYALGTLTVPLAPLRERAADIPALVARLTERLAPRLGLDPVIYTEAALERLTHYLWFGNLAELAAVLGRTLAVHRPRVVEPDQILFTAAPPPAAVAGTVARDEARTAAVAGDMHTTSVTMSTLEVVLGELAHELRNPMVTIKTFAQHLDSVLADPEMRERFASLTGEAIARMDALLETLLDFARFRAPAPQPTDLRQLLDRALAERADELERKDVRIERNGAGPSVARADESQMLFALRSLLEGVVRDLRPHEPLRVRVPGPGMLELELYAERSTAERLRAYVETPAGEQDVEAPPLRFALAASLIRRNGGRLETRAGDGGATVITVTLPGAA